MKHESKLEPYMRRVWTKQYYRQVFEKLLDESVDSRPLPVWKDELLLMLYCKGQMDCPKCGKPMTKHGKYVSENIPKGQRWKCWNCGTTKIIGKRLFSHEQLEKQFKKFLQKEKD